MVRAYRNRGSSLTATGFTLIELLAVFVLIALSVGIVYPVGWRLVQQFEGRMERAAQEQERKKQEFLAFIRDESGTPGTPEPVREQ